MELWLAILLVPLSMQALFESNLKATKIQPVKMTKLFERKCSIKNPFKIRIPEKSNSFNLGSFLSESSYMKSLVNKISNLSIQQGMLPCFDATIRPVQPPSTSREDTFRNEESW